MEQKFISLKKVADNKTVWINSYYIISMCQNKGYSAVLVFGIKEVLRVKESVSEIAEMLQA